MMRIVKPTEVFPPEVLRRLQKELASFTSNPIDGVEVKFDEANITTVHAIFDGPEDTPFEGGRFEARILLGKEFPELPPKAFFNTKIFHPNVDPSTGAICVNTLKKDWDPELGIRHILQVIRCLMIYPNPTSALNEEAGLLFQSNYEQYKLHAKVITEVHAAPLYNAQVPTATASGGVAGAGSKKTVNKSKKMMRRL